MRIPNIKSILLFLESNFCVIIYVGKLCNGMVLFSTKHDIIILAIIVKLTINFQLATGTKIVYDILPHIKIK